MQYHLNGFRSGDPAVAPATDLTKKASEVDVLIIGCGPAGLTLAAQLTAFASVSTRIIERKPGPLEVGQADGIACRSMEMFEALGIAEKVLKEAYQVNEVAFWRADADNHSISRADRIQDVEDDLSEMPHVILNQARVHEFLLEKMRNSATRLQPQYSRELIDLAIDEDLLYPVTASVNCIDEQGTTETINAKYVVGCDGARSKVRQLTGRELKGEAARQLWGVMDVLAVTDFPDIRLKAAIQSADQGSLLIIPREGGYLARLYIELDELHGDERVSDRNVNSAQLISKAQAIMSPFTLDVKEVVWWSAYEIGQRVCDAFDNVPAGDRGKITPRVFIAGDACHTHSPKAGQGMNVSMADSFNLGWKLAAVLQGKAPPWLLDTYTEERCATAKELIDFDKDMARLFSARPENDQQARQFQEYFKKHGRYTAGVETQYSPNAITGNDQHQALARGMIVGRRFHSAPVVRLGDAKPMQLGHVLKADGRWRIIAFAPNDDTGSANQPMAGLCEYLSGRADSLLYQLTPQGADIDSTVDVRAVFQLPHRELDIMSMPDLLIPLKGVYGLIDYEKIFCTDSSENIYDLRGIDRIHGAVIVIRPDQYIARVIPLDAFEQLGSFLTSVIRLN